MGKPSSKTSHIGFPPPLLGPEPQRLPVLEDGGDFFCLEKASGWLIDAHPWFRRAPSLVEAIDHQCRQGKQELQTLGVQRPYGIYMLEPELSGLAFFAKNKAAAAVYKNQFGSDEWVFRFLFLSRSVSESPFACNLPIAAHSDNPCMLVSHTTGKRAHTEFTLLEELGPFSLWEAVTSYPRLHQIRLHAQECGLKIPGETLYGRVAPISKLELVEHARNTKELGEMLALDGMPLHLSALKLPGYDKTLECPLPKKLEGVLKRLRSRYA